MLDLRVYRAAFVPALLALVVVAFSFGNGERADRTTLPSDAFDGDRATATLRELADRYPDRRPGGRGDEALARRVAATFRATGMRTSSRRFEAQTIDGSRELTTVVGVRPGNVSARRVVVLAHRDAAEPGSRAALSSTAALLELAQVYSGRAVRKTLVLVSTSGGSGGNAGAQEFAVDPRGPVEGVLVLGDLAGRVVRSPQVVPWSNRQGIGSLKLQRTVESAVRSEGGLRPRPPTWAAQWARLAVPLTTSEQGEVLGEELPAMLLSVSGERGPGASSAVDAARFERYGRAALRTISSLDARRRGSALQPRESIAGARNVLPGWSVTLLAGTLLLPVLVGAVDGFARARRRRQPVLRWLAWVALCAVPFLLAAAVALLFALTGLLPAAPDAPVAAGTIPLGAGGVACLAVMALVFAAAWARGRRLLAGALGVPRPPTSPGEAPGAAAAATLVLAAVGLVAWLVNPFAAALLVGGLHLWMLAVAPEVRMRRPVAALAVVAGLRPGVLLVVYFARAFGLGPLEVPWEALLLVAGGQVGAGPLIAWAVLLGALMCVAHIVATQRRLRDAPGPKVTRGPKRYAGPGSLGGTKSALRR